MEELIQEEVDLFKGLIDKKNGEPFDFINQFNVPILNALWRITSGERFDYDHPKLESIVARLTENFKRAGNPANIVVYLYPWITKIYPKFMERNRHLGVIHEILDLLEDSIKRHKENLDIDSPNDYTDAMLIEMTKTKVLQAEVFRLNPQLKLRSKICISCRIPAQVSMALTAWRT